MGLTEKVLGWLRQDSGTTGELAEAEEDLLERERLDDKLASQGGGYARPGSTDFSSDQKGPSRRS